MLRQPPVLLGLFALLTFVLAGAVIGQRVGMSVGEGAYATMLALTLIGWFAGRKRKAVHR